MTDARDALTIDALLDLVDRKNDEISELSKEWIDHQTWVDAELQQRDIEINHLRDMVNVANPNALQLAQSTVLSPGWVYLIQEKSEGHYKIGKTKKPEARMRVFGIKLPFKVNIICKIRAANYHQLEKDLHTMFSDKRINGEWFVLDTADVAFIQSLATED
jgi:hypothetical protein